ncbi:MAG TPA: DUF1707 domain-containing protein [Streptosporangiaceae bacterium]|nr:DUF1707 domain-containing protein [Streptosporangiaceae bacterium]
MAIYDGGIRSDRIRVSDADREQVTARLREHFAEGRLTRDELDERVTAALNAKTVGDLRQVMVDLPEHAPVLAGAGVPGPMPRGVRPGPVYVRRGPRLLPLALLVLLVAAVAPGTGFVFLALLQGFLLFMLVAGVMGLFAAHRFRRRVRQHWQLTRGHYHPWGGYQL